MKQLLFSVLACALLCGCTKPIERELPRTTGNEIVSLGFFNLAESSNEFTPYFDKRTLIFEDEDGIEYEWQMAQPVLSDAYSFKRVYPHPDRPNRFVEYQYAGDRAFFSFLCTELGAKLEISLEPDFCRDPMLEEGRLPIDHLNIRGIGFNNNDVLIRTPTLSIATADNQPCNGRRLGNIQLGEQEFTNVSTHRIDIDDRFLEVFYSPQDGVVAIRTSYIFLTLKDAY